MKDDIKTVLLFLQTLHFRDDLEQELFTNLRNFESNKVDTSKSPKLYTQKVSSELSKNTEGALEKFGIFIKDKSGVKIDLNKLDRFVELVEVAKASRSYPWPQNKSKPFLYVSPPSVIERELGGELDDISNLLINLVHSATKNISIMSPFTNKEGLRSILYPLVSCKNNPKIKIYLTAQEKDMEMISNQIKEHIPSNITFIEIYFCSPTNIESDKLPHAKLLTVDSSKGYLGSANFTKQGLNSRFEVGVELDEQQSRAVDKLLSILVQRGLFQKYDEIK